MNLYFSAVSKKHFELLSKLNISINYLRSYFEMRKKQDLIVHNNVNKYFLDSGAYSAKNLNKDIDIDKYIKYIKKYGHNFETFAGLDVIGDADASIENLIYFENNDLYPLPTFHYGSHEKYLDYYADKYDYIALGGMAGQGTGVKQLKPWFQKIFSKYTEKKFHGFGITNIFLIKMFPWHSVDSTTYLNGSKYGHIIHDNKQVHHSQLNSIDQWEELKMYLNEIEITLNEFKYKDSVARDVFNIIQMKKFEHINAVSIKNTNQLSMF